MNIGVIPSWFGNWQNMTSLLLGSNQFLSTIPPQLSLASQLTNLALHNNLLSGPIPEELCKVPSLKLVVSLNVNNLTGNITSTFKMCVALEELDLSSNELS